MKKIVAKIIVVGFAFGLAFGIVGLTNALASEKDDDNVVVTPAPTTPTTSITSVKDPGGGTRP